MKTTAAILTTLKCPLEIWELEIPQLKPGQVLVQVAFSGLCHSQLNEIKGKKGEDRFLPHTLGHEGSGVVVEVGPQVTKVLAGQKVVLSWLKGSGLDVASTHYVSANGIVNSGAISTFLNYAVVSESRVIPLPEAMPLKEAALLGCAIPTGAGVVKNEMKIKAGSSLAVFGVGGVGLSALLAAHSAAAYPIIAVDVVESKLQRARCFGATHVVNAHIDDPVGAIQEMTQGRGVDFVFESAGNKQAMEKGFASLKAPGLCIVAGNLAQGERITIDPFDLIRGKRLSGTWGGGTQIDSDVEHYTHLYLQGGFNLGGLITHVSPLSEINHLFDLLEKGEVGRALVAF